MSEVQDLTTAATRMPLRRPGLRRALRYFTRFGWRTGLQAARVHRRSSHPVELQLPQLPHPLWVRPGSSDVATFDEVFVTREYDLPWDDFSPRHILDLGANVGYTSVWFAARWPEARILAVEPEPRNMVLLQRNTGAYPNINSLQAAVWARPATLSVLNPDGDANAFQLVESSDAGEGVPAFTIPQLLDRMGCVQLDLLKMDVEGAEAEILRGADDWLDRVNVLAVELHDRLVPGCSEALCAALQGRRFRQEIVGQNLVIDFRPQS